MMVSIGIVFYEAMIRQSSSIEPSYFPLSGTKHGNVVVKF